MDMDEKLSQEPLEPELAPLADGERRKGRHPLLKLLFFLLKIGVALALVYWVAAKDFPKFKDSVAKMSPLWLSLAAVCLGLQFLLGAWRWRMLLEAQGIRMPYFEALSLSMQGSFFTLVIPGGAVGGDLVKAGIVASRAQPGRKLGGVMSILVDRMVGLVGLFSLTLLAGIVFFKTILGIGPGKLALLVALMALCVAGLAATLAVFFQDIILRWAPAAWCMRHVDSWCKGAAGRALDAVKTYRERWPVLLKTILLSALVLHPLLFLTLFLLLRGLAGAFPPLAATVLALAFGNTVSALPLTPGGIGTRDAVVKTLLESGGMEAGIATAGPLLYTALMLVFFLSGAAFFAFDSLFSRKAAACVPGRAQ